MECLQNEFSVDDLIVIYMIYKVKNGYEPSFSIHEFMSFLSFYEFMNPDIPVADAVYDGETLFKRFFERKLETHWSTIKDFHTLEKELNPHMEMTYSEDKKDYIISANYKLSDYDKSGISMYHSRNRLIISNRIMEMIREFLNQKPKRTIDYSIEVNDYELTTGKDIAMDIINQIWLSYIDKQIDLGKWPRQCRDISKYLLETDLAEIIDVPSIKGELLNLYQILSKRIAILYHLDKNLKVSSSEGFYLAKANYDLLINGYEKIIDIAFGPYKKYLKIDLENLTFKETHELDGYYDDSDYITKTTKIGNEETKKLVRSFDKQS